MFFGPACVIDRRDQGRRRFGHRELKRFVTWQIARPFQNLISMSEARINCDCFVPLL
jgi:hypothetical protein